MWIILVTFLLLVACWLFFAPIEFQIDTRVPHASVRWITIGNAILEYENERWILKLRLLFFYKQWDLGKIDFAKKKKKRLKKVKPKKRSAKTKSIKKVLNVLRTFRVTHWEMAIDTGDVVNNAWLYPLNFYAPVHDHLFINFSDDNYLLLEARNSPWKLAYSFIR
jgi:hypothetical protein